MSTESPTAEKLADLMPYTKVLRPRPVAGIMYLFYLCAGGAFLFLTSDGIRQLLGVPGFIIWNSFYFGGALICLFGTIVKRYMVEVCGHPFLVAALAVYGIYLLQLYPGTGQTGTILGLAFTFMAAGSGLIGRLIEAVKVILIQRAVIRRTRNG